ncbi:MAG: HEAT repeat domain-containing protein [Planctomycetota bacterium]|nr:HEAT repeat domain-containing protein [Planctomycetota bacterium]
MPTILLRVLLLAAVFPVASGFAAGCQTQPAPADPSAVDELIRQLNADSHQVQSNAFVRLRWLYEFDRWQKAALEEKFVGLIKEGHPRQVGYAILLLSGSGRQDVRELVVACLKSEDPGVRCSAVEWVLGNHEKSAVPQLLQLLKTESGVAKANVARALGAIKDSDAVEGLVASLGDADAAVRESAAAALGAIGNPAAAKPLAKALEAEKKPQMVCWLVEALGKLKSKDGAPAIRATLASEDSFVRRACAKTLGAIADAESVPALIAATKDAEDEVREFAARSLGQIGDKKAVACLTGLLGDSSKRVVQATLIALAEIGDPQAIPAIQSLGPFEGTLPTDRAVSIYTDVQAWALWRLDPKGHKQPEIKRVGHW